MEKPYDVKELYAKVKAKAEKQGLTLAEDAVEILVKESLDGVIEWAEESADMTPTIIDDLGVKGVKQFRDTAFTYIEKIDLDGDGK